MCPTGARHERPTPITGLSHAKNVKNEYIPTNFLGEKTRAKKKPEEGVCKKVCQKKEPEERVCKTACMKKEPDERVC